MSETTLPMSLSAMKMPIEWTRTPFSRAMFMAPPMVLNSATCEIGTYLTVDLRDGLEHVVADRLREARLDPGKARHRPVHLVDQLALARAASPLRLGLQVHQHLAHVDELGIGAVLGPAALGDDALDFRNGRQSRAESAAHA